MAYYAIYNPIKMKFDYVVPTAVYIALLANKLNTNTVTLGDASTAQEILERTRDVFIEQESYRFHVHKVWTHKYREWIVPCYHLDEEPENDNIVYGVYDVMLNDTIRVIGKTAALEYRKIVQNKFLASLNMDHYQTLTFIPAD
jgi:hypothetical protein